MGIAPLAIFPLTRWGLEVLIPGCQPEYPFLLQKVPRANEGTGEADGRYRCLLIKKGLDAFAVISASAFLGWDRQLSPEHKTFLSGAAECPA